MWKEQKKKVQNLFYKKNIKRTKDEGAEACLELNKILSSFL